MNSVSCSSKLIELEEGGVGNFDLKLVGLKQKWQPGMSMAFEVEAVLWDWGIWCYLRV